MLVIKIYKGQTLCSFPSPASRDLKAEAYKCGILVLLIPLV